MGAFWERLRPSLREYPIVYSESGKWLKPAETRIPTGDKEEKGVPSFDALGIEMVDQNLWKYRNILTGNAVGVRRLAVEDIYDALYSRGLVENPQHKPSDFQTQDIWEQLWQGIDGVLENTQGQSAKLEAEELLRACTIAPGVDGRIWPCGATYKSDDHIREIFGALLPSNVTFLAEEGVSLLQHVCPPFTTEAAVGVLECLDPEVLQEHWDGGDFDPAALLHWFDDSKSELNEVLQNRLAKLAVFPSAKGLGSLEDLWLPGGFEDPMGVTDLLDMNSLGGLSDFLRNLGAKELTFEGYAMRYIAEAFVDGSSVSIETKHKHLSNLEHHIGEIRGNGALKNNLSRTNIVECSDGVFRQPGEVYFPREDVRDVLGDHASYASLPKRSEGRQDLYEWLGVGSRPRTKDILRIIELQTTKPPSPKAREIVVKMLEALGKAWESLDGDDKARCRPLKTKEWIPAESDPSKWYKPDQLYAAFNKSLFASQAKVH